MDNLLSSLGGLNLLIQVHTVSAIILTIFLIPLTLLMKKGSRYHRACGITTLLLALVFSASALMMLFNPNLIPHLKADIPEYPIDTAYVYNIHSDLLLIGLASIFIYSIYSAYRIWPRIKHSTDGRITSNVIDWVLAAVALWVTIFYLQMFFYDMDEHPGYANIYLAPSVLMLIFAGLDFYTFVFRPTIYGKPWWALHMSKMLYAWSALIKGFLLRDFHLTLDRTVLHEIASIVIWLSISLLVYLFYRKNLNSRYAKKEKIEKT
ncbi:hypothetical protein [Microbulbifer sp. ANSA005]|uniref:hypothetical protein n=1 Tax=Microbulbifer sp. ANSA005 TaxID=3243362 RepID=UPI0040422351